ncbi:MAG: SpoIIE family protein phosphatase [Clostridiales Family XIII bacterium]|jgi:sigma-B regulation protein RsbU (phosphoserine phosphatase)|nr:SpoIIE family protein phosphatase [Clostridiales Family XIII bacterium]
MSDRKYQNSIYTKVSRKMIFAALLSAFAVFIIATAAIFFIRVGVANVSKDLGDRAADNSATSMTELAENSLLQVANNRAMLSDATLETVSMAVKVISDKATAIMSHPDWYNDRPIMPPDPKNEGKIVAQVVYADGVDPINLRREVGLLGNLQDLQLALLNAEESIATMQIGSETGVMVMVDDMSSVKTSSYDPRVRPWYIAAKKERGLIWTDVFDDAFGRGLAITCGMPYYDVDGNIKGVVSGGMLLATLNDTVAGAVVEQSGKTFIVNEKGDILISKDVAKDQDGNIIRENLLENESPSMRSAAAKMTKGQSGIDRVVYGDKEYFMAYSPLKARPWSFVVLVESGEVLKPAEVTKKQISDTTDGALDEIQNIFFIALGSFIVLLVGIAIFEIRLSRSVSVGITAPIIKLTKEVRGLIGKEDLALDLRIETGDEIEELADAFTDMTAQLKDHIEHLTVITAEKGRIETELNVARHIQASMLPSVFPPFPDRPEFDLYAIMHPAREVGGDFYDFFLIDKDTLCLVIADVSGKGVPAALFMMIAKTLIKNNVQSGMRPSEVFEAVNNILCENNDEEMFVTAFMGYFDISTGKFTFVNAGHNPPLVRQRDGFRPIEARPNFVLAGMPDIRYTENEIILNAGDAICMYTDGVTEAVNSDKELYSLARFIESANGDSLSDLMAFTMNIESSIGRFESGEEQADDITLLTFRYNGEDAPGDPCYAVAGDVRELEIEADKGNLNLVLKFISTSLRSLGESESLISQVEVAAEEVFVNVASYAYASQSGKVKIKRSLGEELALIFEDDGTPFDPLSVPDPDINSIAEDRVIGGLGIYMTKKIMDSVSYRYEDGKNILILIKKLS